ncbi:MAG: Ig-like domain-containing protein [Planctomycetes bacterium]|nr:Ig-like domain-containing protein [Planctomycetota bacterium]
MRNSLRAAVLTLCAVALPIACSGGGGGGGGGGVPASEFVVRTVDPRSGSTNVANDRAVTVALGAPVEGASVTEASFFLTVGGEAAPLAGTRAVSLDGLRITFRPDPWYALATTHEVHVTTALRSREGLNLPEDFLSSFRTSPYSSPEPIQQAFFREVGDPMNSGRSRHTSTAIPLESEVVLIAGGYTSGLTVTNSAEVFAVATETFFPTAGRMAEARANHVAVLLGRGEADRGGDPGGSRLGGALRGGEHDVRGGAGDGHAPERSYRHPPSRRAGPRHRR